MPAGDPENPAAPHQNAPEVRPRCHPGCPGELQLALFRAAGDGQRSSKACQRVGFPGAKTSGAGGAKRGSELADRGSGFAAIPEHDADHLMRDRPLDCARVLTQNEARALLGGVWT